MMCSLVGFAGRTALVLLLMAPLGAAAQDFPPVRTSPPYRPYDLRARMDGVEGADALPVRQALELALDLQLSTPQFDRAISRAGRSGDPTLLPLLWQLARAYRMSGSFTDQLFEAMRRVGERDEAFLEEALAVAPQQQWRYHPDVLGRPLNVPEMIEAAADGALRTYLHNLINAAAARPDSAHLPLIRQIRRHFGPALSTYEDALETVARMEQLSVAEQVRDALVQAGQAFQRTPRPGDVAPSHYFVGELPFGDGLRYDVVWSRERISVLYQQNPAAVEAAIDTYLAETGAGPDAVPLRTYLVRVAATPPPTPLPPPAVVPLCAGQPATIYVAPDGLVVGGPLDGQSYAGVLEGTDGDDVIVGTAAPDLIFGRAGDDLLCGAAGPDALDGGTGVNTLDGGPGTDGCDNGTATACEGPVPTLAHVEPLAECVVLHPDGRYTAYFGYDNLEARPGRVAHGADNRLVLRPLDRIGDVILRQVPSEWFAVPGVDSREPGRTAPFPDYAVSVASSVNEAVVWQLLGQEVLLSPSSPACPTP